MALRSNEKVAHGGLNIFISRPSTENIYFADNLPTSDSILKNVDINLCISCKSCDPQIDLRAADASNPAKTSFQDTKYLRRRRPPFEPNAIYSPHQFLQNK